MCGRFRTYDGRIKKIGDPIDVKLDPDDRSYTGEFSGNAREESFERVWSGRAITGILEATAYEEKGVWFHLPPKSAIQIAALTKGDAHHKEGDVLIVTRAAVTIEEKAVHDRHPLTVSLED